MTIKCVSRVWKLWKALRCSPCLNPVDSSIWGALLTDFLLSLTHSRHWASESSANLLGADWSRCYQCAIGQLRKRFSFVVATGGGHIKLSTNVFGDTCTLSYLPYILAYKPEIFSWILTLKLWGSAYTRVIAQQPELARHEPRHEPLVGTCRVPPAAHRLPRARQAGRGTRHAIYCNLTPLQHSHRARPTFSQRHTQSVSYQAC